MKQFIKNNFKYLIFSLVFIVAGFANSHSASATWTSQSYTIPYYVTNNVDDGLCGATHYDCLLGTSINNSNGSPSAYTWTCKAQNSGTDDQCTESKIPDPNDVTVQVWADKQHVDYKGNTTVHWTSTNADTCDPGPYAISVGSGTGTSGSFQTPFLTNDTTYPVTCRRSDFIVAYTNNYRNVPFVIKVNGTTIYDGYYTSDPLYGYSSYLPAQNAVVELYFPTGKIIQYSILNGVNGGSGSSTATWNNVNGPLDLNFATN